MSFDKINYQGLEQLGDIVDDSTQIVEYEHIYRTNFDGTLHQHACFTLGHWCWKQAFERPDKAVKFLLARKKK